ncbi:PadR family transcriptional regulator [Burkholderia pseudomallei]|uniref:PadR family transcriptional regulator n=1 Tax=Burkholderia pseudomallei TaxID=28450 RepID=UPI000E68F249|nr:PadR family transcriptional regulator [Burkholderia pseudomallei]RIV54865.1 PadR family transcriptional regulator [Burkholderia pseudomallei]RIV63232.1 PadR family transcriptional regulator [Burkholderia pseudomallei]
MSLPHALLTSLAERPGSGPELTRRFDRSIGYFWHATHQQIYRELARLEDEGWVESTPVEQARGRKRAYRILPAGRKELKRWIAQHDDPKPLRDELMIRLRAEAVVGPTGLADEIRRRLDLHRQKLALYREIEARDFTHGMDTRERRLQHLVLHAGIMQESQSIELLRQALDILSMPDARAKPRGA